MTPSYRETAGRRSGFRVPDDIPGRIDWEAERQRIDLAEVITRELGRPVIRNGRPWWVCPFHEDRRPSLIARKLDDGRQRWKCYGCNARGDAVAFLMEYRSMSFPEVRAYLTGGPAPSGKPRPRPRPEPTRKAPALAAPSGLPEADALALVETAAARLWTPEGSEGLAYLTGPRRCLTHETIRSARLGWTPRADGVPWRPPGVVVPWFAAGRLAMVKVRPLDDWREGYPEEKRPPKYLEAYRDPALLSCYPGPQTIRPGRPLVVVEGEFDALCLGEALGELAAVVTLGSASARPTPAILGWFLTATPWIIATDSDPAGEMVAADWPATARRVGPPGSFKDWTEVKAGGVGLARWWRDILAGFDRPPLFTWPELAGWRWGPAVGDSTPE